MKATASPQGGWRKPEAKLGTDEQEPDRRPVRRGSPAMGRPKISRTRAQVNLGAPERSSNAGRSLRFSGPAGAGVGNGVRRAGRSQPIFCWTTWTRSWRSGATASAAMPTTVPHPAQPGIALGQWLRRAQSAPLQLNRSSRFAHPFAGASKPRSQYEHRGPDPPQIQTEQENSFIIAH